MGRVNGDPIIPAPHVVHLPRIIGGNVTIVGYRPETTIAEKGVTILERGVTSTRWRDYVDIVQLFEHYHIDRDELLASARSVAAHRGVELGPISSHVEGYGATSQAKWAAWRSKEHLEDITADDLDEQLRRVAKRLDPIFGARLTLASPNASTPVTNGVARGAPREAYGDIGAVSDVS